MLSHVYWFIKSEGGSLAWAEQSGREWGKQDKVLRMTDTHSKERGIETDKLTQQSDDLLCFL